MRGKFVYSPKWSIMIALSLNACNTDRDDINKSPAVSGSFNMVMEITGEEAEVIIRDRTQMEEEVEADYEFASEVVILSDSEIEVRARIPELIIEINGQKTEAADDGSFTFRDLRLTAGDVVTVSNSADNFAYFDHIVTEEEAASGQLDLENRSTWDHYMEKLAEHNCGDTGSSDDGSVPPPSTYSCLDNNGTTWSGFRYSDCYMSLFYGPASYSWMCWYEAMNYIHDHKGNVWCDGSHNCSLFVHNWRWNCQNWHTHSGYWTVGSGC